MHNAKDMDWQRWVPHWSRRHAIRLIAIGDQCVFIYLMCHRVCGLMSVPCGSVAQAFVDMFAEAADSHDPALYTADFEHIPVDVHIPVLPIPNLPLKETPRYLTKAVIQGKFEMERRDYLHIFQELIDSLTGPLRSCSVWLVSGRLIKCTAEDPTAWGYHPLEGRTAFEPNHDSPVPPFQLLLVGSQYIGVPDALQHVVVIHRDLPYKEFYNLIANSDIVLPAFADNSCKCDWTFGGVAVLRYGLSLCDRLRDPCQLHCRNRN